MEKNSQVPADPLAFIKRCVRGGRIFWTLRVQKRLRSRHIPRDMILAAVESYEIIEAYPDDKYMPSYLVYGQYEGRALHLLFAADLEEERVRVVTAYYPDREEWGLDLKRRKQP